MVTNDGATPGGLLSSVCDIATLYCVSLKGGSVSVSPELSFCSIGMESLDSSADRKGHRPP